MKTGRASGAALVIVALAACGGRGGGKLAFDAGRSSPTAGVTAAGPFATPGERIVYRLSLHGVEIGAFSVAVGDITEVAGRRALAVEAGFQSTGIAAVFRKVRTEFLSWVDVATGRPVMGRIVETAGANDPRIETTEARFHAREGNQVPIALIAPDGTETVAKQTLAGDSLWDVPSILLHLRGWNADDKSELSVEALRSQFIWRVRFQIARRESLATELGQLSTVRIDGVARRVLRDGTWEPAGDIRNMSIWITDDADRVPVLLVAKTDWGSVRMAIVEYRSGSGPNLRGGT